MWHKKEVRVFAIQVSLVTTFLVFLAIAIYPFVSEALGGMERASIMQTYRHNIHTDVAHSRLADTRRQGVEDPFSKKALERESSVVSRPASFYAKQTVGVIHLPTIHQTLPIFNETTSDLLSRGATWVNDTSKLGGGKNRHAAVSAHRGLPTATLFSNLDKMAVNDLFIIEVRGKYLAYKVEKISTVLPDNLDVLKVQKGKDLVSLITCTPYMVNSHRLIVTGTRVPFDASMLGKLPATSRPVKQLLGLGGMIFIVLVVVSYYLFTQFRYMKCKQMKFTISYADAADGEFKLFDASGTRPIIRRGEPIVVTKNNDGVLVVKNVPWMNYLLKSEDKVIRVKRPKSVRGSFKFIEEK